MLFLVDAIDEIAIQNLKSYKEKNFVDISKEDLNLGKPVLTLLNFILLFFCRGIHLLLSCMCYSPIGSTTVISSHESSCHDLSAILYISICG